MAFPQPDEALNDALIAPLEVPEEPPPPGAIESAGVSTKPPETFKQQAIRRFWANKAAVVGLVILILGGLAALLAPFLTHYSPIVVPLTNLQPDLGPSPQHWLGTDSVGRDVYTRMLYGMRGPVGVGFSGSILCTLIGAITGVVAGYFGGWIDEIFSRVTEIIFVLPGLLLIILCVALFGNALNGPLGSAGRYVMIMIFLSTDSWPVIMRLTRAETLSMKSSQFVEAAVVVGSSSRNIIWKHLLPNIFGILLVQAALLLPGFLFATSALGLFGLGAQPPNPDIGSMVIAGAEIMALNWVEVIAPTLVLCILILAGTFLGDGMRDAFDTRGGS